jgi:thioredoxin 1
MELIELNKDTIATEITNNSISVIEFYSDTCSECKMLMPILEGLSDEQTEVKFFKINSQQNMQTCIFYRVLSLPTTLVFKNEELSEKVSGFKTDKEMKDILSKVV